MAWRNPIEIKSESSSRVYIVSELVRDGYPTGTWGCSCSGWKAYGRCKHLRTMSLTSARAPSQPAPKGLGMGDNSAFQDGAFDHYDTSQGFGSPEEWYRRAEERIRGRGRYRRPKTGRPGGRANDMALLGLTQMPEDAKGLLRAMRKMAMKLHPDHGGDPEAFKAMYAAFERLSLLY